MNTPATFTDLVQSRRQWLDGVLQPWCGQASRRDLLMAERDWANLAGAVDAQKTLWIWAWSRFPVLVHEVLGLDESAEVDVVCVDGRTVRGYPDARESREGMLHLVSGEGETTIAIDEIARVERV